MTTGVAGGGSVVVSYEKKRSPPSILEVFLIGLRGVLGFWCQYSGELVQTYTDWIIN